MSNLIQRVQHRRGQGSEESTSTNGSNRQWLGNDGVGLGMLMLVSMVRGRGKGEGSGEEDGSPVNTTNVGFVGLGGKGLKG
jgi:hypothetical protein